MPTCSWTAVVLAVALLAPALLTPETAGAAAFRLDSFRRFFPGNRQVYNASNTLELMRELSSEYTPGSPEWMRRCREIGELRELCPDAGRIARAVSEQRERAEQRLAAARANAARRFFRQSLPPPSVFDVIMEVAADDAPIAGMPMVQEATGELLQAVSAVQTPAEIGFSDSSLVEAGPAEAELPRVNSGPKLSVVTVRGASTAPAADDSPTSQAVQHLIGMLVTSYFVAHHVGTPAESPVYSARTSWYNSGGSPGDSQGDSEDTDENVYGDPSSQLAPYDDSTDASMDDSAVDHPADLIVQSPRRRLGARGLSPPGMSGLCPIGLLPNAQAAASISDLMIHTVQLVFPRPVSRGLAFAMMYLFFLSVAFDSDVTADAVADLGVAALLGMVCTVSAAMFQAHKLGSE